MNKYFTYILQQIYFQQIQQTFQQIFLIVFFLPNLTHREQHIAYNHQDIQFLEVFFITAVIKNIKTPKRDNGFRTFKTLKTCREIFSKSC